MNNFPIYEALITDEDEGMYCLSLVDYPAVEKDFVAFRKEKEDIKFSIQDESEHMLLGVVMRADYPIYRRDGEYEYYIKYSKETIKQMSQKLLKDGLQNSINLMHQDNMYVDGVEMVQIFIKDTEKGINPNGFEDVEDGSLFAQFKVNNEEVWKHIQNGDFKGYSLEGVYTVKETFKETIDKEEEEILNLISQLKNNLKNQEKNDKSFKN